MRPQQETVVRVRGNRAAVHAALRKVASAAAGNVPEARMVQRSLLCRVGLTALMLIRKAFVVKSARGIDEAGDKWAEHSVMTTAHRNYKAAKGRRVTFDMFLRRAQADRSIIDRYGQPPVPILRDVGLLLNSFSPGVEPDTAPTDMPIPKDGVRRLEHNAAIVGTNRKGAKANHEGKPDGKYPLPRRRLWPSPRKWPHRWWSELLAQQRQGVIDIVVWFLQRI